MTERTDEYRRITALFLAGRFEEGSQGLDAANETLPRCEFIECTGNLHFYKRESQKAIDSYEEAMIADSNYDVGRYHYLLGVQEERQGNLTDAFTRYQAAIEADPTFVDAYVELGGLLSKVEDYKGALICYTDALRLDRTDLRNFANRAEVLRVLSNSDPTRQVEYVMACNEYSEAKTRLPTIDRSCVW